MMIDAPVKPSSHSLSSVLPALRFISVIARNSHQRVDRCPRQHTACMMLRQLHWQVPALDVTVLSTAQLRTSLGTCELHVYAAFAIAYCR